MQSLWNEEDYSLACADHERDELGRDVASRVYTSQLLGQETRLVLHGGGNTSVKSRARELDGRDVDVLIVKGSGWDLETIQAAGFAVCRLEPLLALCERTELTDEEMVRGLRSQMLDPSGPTPSVEALLHALVPGKFVDHTHADAVLSILDQPDGADRARAVWGDNVLVVPYVMPGFVLARAVRELIESHPLAESGMLLLDKHGIFTWGSTARESYERMITEVSRAEAYLGNLIPHGLETRPDFSPPPPPSLRVREIPRGASEILGASAEIRADISMLVRGSMATAQRGSRMVAVWRTDETILKLLGSPNAERLLTAGTATPDHVIRTKPRPLWLGGVFDRPISEQRQLVSARIAAYCTWYDEYFARGTERLGRQLRQLDPLPRVVAVPGFGILGLGNSKREAMICADIYEHTAGIITTAASLSGFSPTTEAELFELEYWSLEQAKVGRAPEKPLSRHVAFVTGAAAGIGLATARQLLTAGCHVMLTDLTPGRLKEAADGLRKQFGTLVESWPCDVTEPTQVREAMTHCVLAFGGLDHVISNAGTAPSGLLHTSEGDRNLRESLELNLLGHQNVAKCAAEHFLRQGCGGTLAFNASKSAFNPGPAFGPYAVAKAGVIALAKQYAVDLGSAGVRSNAINADRVRTDLFGGGVLEARAAARGLSTADYFTQNLLRRETTSADVADAFCWLCTAHATTGCVVTVDGGNAAAFPR